MTEKLDKNGLTEEEYIREYKKKNYPKPALTADIVVFAHENEDVYVLLIRRGGHPFIGSWALPGGFAEKSEQIENTAARELEEETGVSGLGLAPVGLFTEPGRDPRGWTVSQAFRADVELSECRPKAGDDAAEAEWFRLEVSGQKIKLHNEKADISFEIGEDAEKEDQTAGPGDLSVKWNSSARLAFDHAKILYRAVKTESMEKRGIEAI